MQINVMTHKTFNPAPAKNVIPKGIFQFLNRLVAIATNMTINPNTPNIAMMPSFIATVDEGIEVNDRRFSVNTKNPPIPYKAIPNILSIVIVLPRL